MQQCSIRTGLTLVEAIVVIAVIVTLLVLALATSRPRRVDGQSLKDKVYITQIHKGMLGWAAENDGHIPVPSNAHLDAGPQDTASSHTAPFCSFMVAQNLFNPELLVGPTEVSAAIRIKTDYDYSAYNPAAGTYWDSTFQARIDNQRIGSNTSYAHSALCGDRLTHSATTNWTHRSQTGFAVIGNRGTRNGVTTGDEYKRSPTLRLHRPLDVWIGNVCFADNHAETIQDFFSVSATIEHDGMKVKDNLYAAEFSHPKGNQGAADSFLGVFIGSTEFTVDPIYDPLE
jgi:hypothetical protein